MKGEDPITSCEGSSVEILPRGALIPVGKLGVSDKSMAIASEVYAHEGTMCIPYDENTNCSYSNIHPNNLQSNNQVDTVSEKRIVSDCIVSSSHKQPNKRHQIKE